MCTSRRGRAFILAITVLFSTIAAVAEQRALLLDEGPLTFDFRQALVDEQIAFTQVVHWGQFESLLKSESFDLVVVSIQLGRRFDWAALIDYVNSGRPAVLTYYDLTGVPPLAAAFECQATASLTQGTVSSIVHAG